MSRTLSSTLFSNTTVSIQPIFSTLVTAITLLYIHHTPPLPPSSLTWWWSILHITHISTYIQHHLRELTAFSAVSGMTPTYTESHIQPHTPSYTLWSVNKDTVELLFILQNLFKNLRHSLEHLIIHALYNIKLLRLSSALCFNWSSPLFYISWCLCLLLHFHSGAWMETLGMRRKSPNGWDIYLLRSHSHRRTI